MNESSLIFSTVNFIPAIVASSKIISSGNIFNGIFTIMFLNNPLSPWLARILLADRSWNWVSGYILIKIFGAGKIFSIATFNVDNNSIIDLIPLLRLLILLMNEMNCSSCNQQKSDSQESFSHIHLLIMKYPKTFYLKSKYKNIKA